MTHFNEGQLLEWSHQHWTGYFTGVGHYSLEMGWKLDRIVEAAERNGIGIQLVLQHHGQFSTTTNANWNQNPYNAANAREDGGFLQTPKAFFSSPKAIRLTKDKYRYIVARWGYSRAILAWELFNEVQFTDGWRQSRTDVVNWHQTMSDYIADIDPHNHLITTSSDAEGFEALWRQESIDIIQVHHYGGETIGFFANAMKRLAHHGKPIVMGEFGAGQTAGVGVPECHVDRMPPPFQEQLRDGLVLHNGIWSAFHVRSSAHLWWWDCYIEALDLFDAFSGLVHYAAGEDPARYNMTAARFDTSGLPIWVLATPGLNGFWDLSQQTTFETQADGSVPGIENLSAWLHGSSKETHRSDPTFHVHVTEGDHLRIHVKAVSAWGQNSLRVRIDGVETFSSPYANGASSFAIDVPLPEGQRIVQIENTGQDWFEISSYEFINRHQGSLEFIGLAGDRRALIWVHDVDSRYGRIARGEFSGVSMALLGLPDGDYTATYFDTWGNSGPFQSDRVSSTEGRLPLTLPGFTRDLAVKIKPFKTNTE